MNDPSLIERTCALVKRSTLWRYGRAGVAVMALLPLLGTRSELSAGDFKRYASHPNPAGDYAEAVRRVEAKIASEVGFYEGSHSFLLTHGARTEKVIVLAHGFGSSPAPFREIATRLYDRGCNVLVVAMPHHGLANRMTTEQARMRVEDFTRYGDEVVDIARGLGDHVTMAGISGGGLVTAWVAQQRKDVDRAVLISPGLGFKALRGFRAPVMATVIRVLPNWYIWEDSKLKENEPRPYNYVRMSSKGFGQVMNLAGAVKAMAREEAPAAGTLIVVTNLNDPGIDNAAVDKVAALWRKHRPNDVQSYAFPAELRLGHDIIDVADPHMNVAAVYPRLLELIDR
jgi:alpha-beta hydrolase superfamily lysophospholipase